MKYALASVTAFVSTVWQVAVATAQATAPGPTAPPAAGGAGGSGAALTIVGLIVGLIVLVGIGVKFIDLKRKRDAEAVHLQAQISDALLREESMFGLAITPTAHIPLWSGSPATVEITGHVPSPEQAEAARRLVEREAARIRPDVKIVDRIVVDSAAMQRAA